MNDFEDKLKILKDKVFLDSLVRSYFNLKSQIDENEELKLLDKCIKNYAQNMTKYITDDKKYFFYKAKYEETYKQYHSHPLVVNMKQTMQEIQEMLWQLKKIIE